MFIPAALVAIECLADSSGLPSSGAEFGSRSHAATGAIHIWVAFAVTWDYGVSQSWAAAKDHVWVHGVS